MGGQNMKKDVRKFIDDNRDLFDDKEPSAGHMQRMEATLDKLADEKNKDIKPGKRIRLMSFAAVAASIAIIIGVAINFQKTSDDGTQTIYPVSEGVSTDEFRATNEYYNQQMKEQIAEIMCKLPNTDENNQEQLTTDLQQLMNDNKEFVKEIKKSENPEIAMRYLVKHYKTNIQILESINEKLGKYTNC